MHFLMEFAIQAGYNDGGALKMDNELENILQCLKTAYMKLDYRSAKATIAFWSLQLKHCSLNREYCIQGNYSGKRTSDAALHISF